MSPSQTLVSPPVTPDGEGHTDCRTCNRRESQLGRSWYANTKEAEATRNSTPRKDVGAVLPATAVRAHNYDTFAFLVCEKQIGPKELSQKLAGSLMRAATANVCRVNASKQQLDCPVLSVGVARRVNLRRGFLKLASVWLESMKAECGKIVSVLVLISTVRQVQAHHMVPRVSSSGSSSYWT